MTGLAFIRVLAEPTSSVWTSLNLRWMCDESTKRSPQVGLEPSCQLLESRRLRVWASRADLASAVEWDLLALRSVQ